MIESKKKKNETKGRVRVKFRHEGNHFKRTCKEKKIEKKNADEKRAMEKITENEKGWRKKDEQRLRGTWSRNITSRCEQMKEEYKGYAGWKEIKKKDKPRLEGVKRIRKEGEEDWGKKKE